MTTTDPRQLSLVDLAAACQQETSRFQRGQSSRDEFCRELFYRAICLRDHGAWERIVFQYRGVVLAWIRHHPASSSAREGDDYWLNRTFERFWAAVGPDRFDRFPDLASLLKYLKMCVHSVLLDDVRAQGAAQLESLDDAPARSVEAPDFDMQAVGQLAGQELWNTIVAELPDEAERLVVYCSFALDLKPSEIYQRYSGRYATVADVYRIKRNVLERLRRSPRIQQFVA